MHACMAFACTRANACVSTHSRALPTRHHPPDFGHAGAVSACTRVRYRPGTTLRTADTPVPAHPRDDGLIAPSTDAGRTGRRRVPSDCARENTATRVLPVGPSSVHEGVACVRRRPGRQPRVEKNNARVGLKKKKTTPAGCCVTAWEAARGSSRWVYHTQPASQMAAEHP